MVDKVLKTSSQAVKLELLFAVKKNKERQMRIHAGATRINSSSPPPPPKTTRID